MNMKPTSLSLGVLLLGVLVVVSTTSTVCSALLQHNLPRPEDILSGNKKGMGSNDEDTKGKNLPPLIFIPGLTSSTIDAELHNAPSVACPSTTTSRIPVWPPQINSTRDYLCFLENIKLYFNPVTQTFSNRPGEKTFLRDYGGFDGLPDLTIVSKPLIKYGYELKKNLFAVPFDWRGPAVAFPDFFTNLTKLVEHAYETNGQRKVTLLAVSYGPQFALSFLHRQSQAWKDKYIHWFIAESPVWSGAPATVLAVTSGYDTTSPNALLFTRQVSIETASDFWLFPRAGATNSTWGEDEVIAKTPSRVYTAANYTQLMKDIGFGFKVPAVEFTINDADLKDFAYPGVNTFVTYGYNIGTPGWFEWDVDFAHNITGVQPFPTIHNATDTGDGIVTLRSSLRGWDEWRTTMPEVNKTLLYKGYKDQQHGYCLAPMGHDNCWAEVLNLINNGVVPPNANKA